MLRIKATLKPAGAAAGSEYYNIVLEPTTDKRVPLQPVIPTVYAPLVATAGQQTGELQKPITIGRGYWGYILLQVANADNYSTGKIVEVKTLKVVINGESVSVDLSAVGSLRVLDAPDTTMYSGPVTHTKSQ